RDEFRFAPPLNQSPLIPATAGSLSVLGTNPAAVVPAQAGTHNHQGFGCRWPCHIAFAAAYGSPPARRLRGDDSGESLLHIFASGNAENSAKVLRPAPVLAKAGIRGDERD